MTMKKQNTRYHMLYPNELLKKIDKMQHEKGFTTRAQTIIHLLHNAIKYEEEEKRKNKEL